MSDCLVSVVIPILNEERYIQKCIESVANQDFPKENMELILVDGMSEDNTVAIIKSLMDKYNFIKLIYNEKKTVQYALNEGIKEAVGEIIVRMDAHGEYDSDYISKCVEYLNNTDAINVGGPMIAIGNGGLQSVIAVAYHSKFALGGGKNHEKDYTGYADTVFLGAFKREDIVRLGMYDERLPRSEDDDLNFRIIENGGKIYITSEIKSKYYPRSTYRDLFKQYYEYGLWKVAVIKKHKKPARLSHLVPGMFVAYLAACPILPMKMTVPIILLYLLLNMCFSFNNKYVSNFFDKIRLMFVHTTIHLAYGLGFWVGVFKFFNYKW